jgi:hypothetical protein
MFISLSPSFLELWAGRDSPGATANASEYTVYGDIRLWRDSFNYRTNMALLQSTVPGTCLCSSCSDLLDRDLYSRGEFKVYNEASQPPMKVLETLALSGCPICIFILPYFKTCIQSNAHVLEATTEYSIECSVKFKFGNHVRVLYHIRPDQGLYIEVLRLVFLPAACKWSRNSPFQYASNIVSRAGRLEPKTTTWYLNFIRPCLVSLCFIPSNLQQTSYTMLAWTLS